VVGFRNLTKNHPQIFFTRARVGDSHTQFKMTIGELRDELEDWPEGDEIIFGCEELEFYRFKKRGDDTVQLEFNQTIYKDAKTGKWHVDE
jgi:hypothetical protein